jgi:hypothetical protein
MAAGKGNVPPQESASEVLADPEETAAALTILRRADADANFLLFGRVMRGAR